MRRVLLAIALLGSCGDNTPIAPTVKLVSLAITPANLTLAAGTAHPVAASAVYDDGTIADVTLHATWSSSDDATATATAGVVMGDRPGTATIRAVFDGATATAPVTVDDATLVSIAITPMTVTLAMGTSQQLTATGTFSDASVQDLTMMASWSSSSGAAAVTTMGLLSGASIGDSIISARVNEVSGSLTVHVTAARLTSIDIAPVNPAIPKGLDRPLTATGHFTDGGIQDLTTQVTWSTSDGSVASIGSSGIAHAQSIGTSTITAALGAVHAETQLTVTPADLVSISIDPVNPSVPLGFAQPFHASGAFTDGTIQDVTSQVIWESTDPSFATISNASGSKGVATTVAVGSTSIRATFGGITASTQFAVTPAALVSIAVTPSAPMLPKGIGVQLGATGTFSDGSTRDITTHVVWQSDAPAIADVSNAVGSQGLVSTFGTGQATLAASSTGVTGSVLVTVTPAALVSIAVTPADATFPFDPAAPPLFWTQRLTAIGTFSDGSTLDLTRSVAWDTSDPAVVFVVNLAPNQGVATVQGLGTATVSATRDGVVGTAAISVVFATLDALVIAPASPTIEKSKSVPIAATGTFSNGQVLDTTNVVSWTSDDPSVAALAVVDGTLTLAGVEPGTSTIHALAAVEATTVATVTDYLGRIDVVFSGDAFGEVLISGAPVPIPPYCTSSCSVVVPSGTAVTVHGATPNGFTNPICAGPGVDATGQCEFIALAGTTTVAFEFTTDSKWTQLLPLDPGERALAADFDGDGNLIVGSSSHVFKLDSDGAAVWTQAMPAQQVRTGPGGTIYLISSGNLVALDATGAVRWTRPVAVATVTAPFEFVHNLAASDDGDVAVRLDTKAIELYDELGALRWTRTDTFAFAGCVTFDSSGAVWATAEDENPDLLDVVGVARDGTLVNRLHPLSGYHGMTAVDAQDHIITRSSGHGFIYDDRRSQADVVDSSSSARTGSASYVDIGLVVKGANGIGVTSDQPFSCLSLNWSCILDVPYGPLGVRAVEVAADRTMHTAIVGQYFGLGITSLGLIKVFGP